MGNPTVIRMLTALGLIAATVLAGCKGGTSTVPPASASSAASTTTKAVPTGPYGELRMATATFGGQVLDPVPAPTGAIATLLAPMFDFLFTVDSKGQLIGRLVEKWDVSPDGLSWTYVIRKGVKFHNG
ncbi:MAG: hypothetical protein HYY32_03785, partial [Chloroflexi bacterium]|nr:hypothetical protein [Chloroflexota bacterium]